MMAFTTPCSAKPKPRGWGWLALCLLLPVLNLLTTGDHLPAQILRGDWESAGVELFVLATGVAAAWAVRWLHRRGAAGTPPHRPVRPDRPSVAAHQGSLA